MKKRIISLLIALSTVITLFVPSAVVHAELGIKNELQVSLMAALNIVPGYPSSYDAEAKVSAKDFVSFAYRFMKKYDLDEESDTIGASTAIKIILDIINYDEIMGNTDNYFNFASQMGLTKNVGVSLNSSEPLTYDQMVMLFWNTLDMKALKLDGINSYSYTDETVMEHYLKIYEGKGVVWGPGTSTPEELKEQLVILQDKNVSTKRFKFWKGKGKNEENINQNKENIDQ